MNKSKVLCIFLVFLNLYGCSNAGDRAPAVAGQFYPANPGELKKMVDGFLSGVPKQDVEGKIAAFIVPHAGYVYSGQTAAYAYKLLKNSDIKTVVLVGNSHNMMLSKGAIYSKGNFITPLGKVCIDEVLAAKILEKSELFEANTQPHNPEHSLEVQLPFLERTLSDFKIVPILLSGNFSLEDCEKMGKAISDAVTELPYAARVLMVASSDMSHYPSWANANMADSKALGAVTKFDPVVLKTAIDSVMGANIPNESCVFCGQEAVCTVMYSAKNLGADKTKVLNYTNSGNSTGDKSRVVGYGACVFSNSKEKQIKGEAMEDFKISEKNQQVLLETARRSVEYYLKNRNLQKVSAQDPELKVPSAVFVTLTTGGQLRGCIGTTTPQVPLLNAVNEMAAAAAFEDTRFKQVSEKEIKNIRFEISILSPMCRVKDAGEIKQNVHGVVVRRGGRSGLFLPQVWEHFSSKDEFLSELCFQKAGLSPDAWKDPQTELYVFTVFAFEEKK